MTIFSYPQNGIKYTLKMAAISLTPYPQTRLYNKHNTKMETLKMTNTEFNALARNADGDIINLTDAYPFITPAQRERLTSDDWSRMIELDEELEYLRAEFN